MKEVFSSHCMCELLFNVFLNLKDTTKNSITSLTQLIGWFLCQAGLILADLIVGFKRVLVYKLVR